MAFQYSTYEEDSNMADEYAYHGLGASYHPPMETELHTESHYSSDRSTSLAETQMHGQALGDRTDLPNSPRHEHNGHYSSYPYHSSGQELRADNARHMGEPFNGEFYSRQGEDMITLCQAKCVLLGSVAAGKTSLLNALRYGEPHLAPAGPEGRTIGIEVHSVSVRPDTRLWFYDFGGHDTYHFSQQLFLTQRAIYLIAVDISSYDQAKVEKTLRHWYNILTARLVSPVICLLATHIDECYDREEMHRCCKEMNDMLAHIAERHRQKIENELAALKAEITDESTDSENAVRRFQPRTLRQPIERLNNLLRNRPRIFNKVCPISSKTLEGMDQLKMDLLTVVNENESLFPPKDVPTQWIGLCEEVSSKKEDVPFVTIEEFIELAKEFDIVEDRVQSVLVYLQSIGIVLHYQDYRQNSELSKYVFVNPNLLLAIFGLVFNHNYFMDETRFVWKHQALLRLPHFDFVHLRKNLKERGVIGEKLLKCFWDALGISDEVYQAIVPLLEKFDLCYEIRMKPGEAVVAGRHFLFPYLMNKKKPPEVDFMWSDDLMDDFTQCGVELNFTTPNLPFGFLEKVLVRAHTYVDHCLAWKQGLVAFCDEGQDVVRIDARLDARGNALLTISARVRNDRKSMARHIILLLVAVTNRVLLHHYPGMVAYWYCLCSHCISKMLHQKYADVEIDRFPADNIVYTAPDDPLQVKCINCKAREILTLDQVFPTSTEDVSKLNRKMSEPCCRAIKVSEPHLIQHMSYRDVMNSLLRKQLLNIKQAEAIGSMPNHEERTKKLLSYLPDCDQQAFNVLLQELAQVEETAWLAEDIKARAAGSAKNATDVKSVLLKQTPTTAGWRVSSSSQGSSGTSSGYHSWSSLSRSSYSSTGSYVRRPYGSYVQRETVLDYRNRPRPNYTLKGPKDESGKNTVVPASSTQPKTSNFQGYEATHVTESKSKNPVKDSRDTPPYKEEYRSSLSRYEPNASTYTNKASDEPRDQGKADVKKKQTNSYSLEATTYHQQQQQQQQKQQQEPMESGIVERGPQNTMHGDRLPNILVAALDTVDIGNEEDVLSRGQSAAKVSSETELIETEETIMVKTTELIYDDSASTDYFRTTPETTTNNQFQNLRDICINTISSDEYSVRREPEAQSVQVTPCELDDGNGNYWNRPDTTGATIQNIEGYTIAASHEGFEGPMSKEAVTKKKVKKVKKDDGTKKVVDGKKLRKKKPKVSSEKLTKDNSNQLKTPEPFQFESDHFHGEKNLPDKKTTTVLVDKTFSPTDSHVKEIPTQVDKNASVLFLNNLAEEHDDFNPTNQNLTAEEIKPPINVDASNSLNIRPIESSPHMISDSQLDDLLRDGRIFHMNEINVMGEADDTALFDAEISNSENKITEPNFELETKHLDHEGEETKAELQDDLLLDTMVHERQELKDEHATVPFFTDENRLEPKRLEPLDHFGRKKDVDGFHNFNRYTDISPNIESDIVQPLKDERPVTPQNLSRVYEVLDHHDVPSESNIPDSPITAAFKEAEPPTAKKKMRKKRPKGSKPKKIRAKTDTEGVENKVSQEVAREVSVSSPKIEEPISPMETCQNKMPPQGHFEPSTIHIETELENTSQTYYPLTKSLDNRVKSTGDIIDEVFRDDLEFEPKHRLQHESNNLRQRGRGDIPRAKSVADLVGFADLGPEHVLQAIGPIELPSWSMRRSRSSNTLSFRRNKSKSPKLENRNPASERQNWAVPYNWEQHQSSETINRGSTSSDRWRQSGGIIITSSANDLKEPTDSHRGPGPTRVLSQPVLHSEPRGGTNPHPLPRSISHTETPMFQQPPVPHFSEQYSVISRNALQRQPPPKEIAIPRPRPSNKKKIDQSEENSTSTGEEKIPKQQYPQQQPMTHLGAVKMSHGAFGSNPLEQISSDSSEMTDSFHTGRSFSESDFLSDATLQSATSGVTIDSYHTTRSHAASVGSRALSYNSRLSERTADSYHTVKSQTLSVSDFPDDVTINSDISELTLDAFNPHSNESTLVQSPQHKQDSDFTLVTPMSNLTMSPLRFQDKKSEDDLTLTDSSPDSTPNKKAFQGDIMASPQLGSTAVQQGGSMFNPKHDTIASTPKPIQIQADSPPRRPTSARPRPLNQPPPPPSARQAMLPTKFVDVEDDAPPVPPRKDLQRPPPLPNRPPNASQQQPPPKQRSVTFADDYDINGQLKRSSPTELRVREARMINIPMTDPESSASAQSGFVPPDQILANTDAKKKKKKKGGKKGEKKSKKKKLPHLDGPEIRSAGQVSKPNVQTNHVYSAQPQQFMPPQVHQEDVARRQVSMRVDPNLPSNGIKPHAYVQPYMRDSKETWLMGANNNGNNGNFKFSDNLVLAEEPYLPASEINANRYEPNDLQQPSYQFSGNSPGHGSGQHQMAAQWQGDQSSPGTRGNGQGLGQRLSSQSNLSSTKSSSYDTTV